MTKHMTGCASGLSEVVSGAMPGAAEHACDHRADNDERIKDDAHPRGAGLGPFIPIRPRDQPGQRWQHEDAVQQHGMDRLQPTAVAYARGDHH